MSRLARFLLLLVLVVPVSVSAQGLSESDGGDVASASNLYCPNITQSLQRYDCDPGVSGASCRRQVGPNPQVAELQKFLMSYYPDNTTLSASGAFLNGTRNAVIQFQLDTGVISSSASGGLVGPATRAKIASLCGGTVASDTGTAQPLVGPTNGTTGGTTGGSIVPSGTTGSPLVSVNTNMTVPMLSAGKVAGLKCPANFFQKDILPGQADSITDGTADVYNLQAFLRSYLNSNLSEGSGLSSYGAQTKAAVTAFQLAEGLITQQEANAGLGGYARNATRTRINNLCFPTLSTVAADATAAGLSIQTFRVVPATVNAGASAGFTWTSRASNSCAILESIDGGAETVRFPSLGQNGYSSFNPTRTATYTLSCSDALGATVRSAPLVLTVNGVNTQTFTYTPHCYYRSTTNTTETDLSTSASSNEVCVSACRARLASEQGTVSFCRYVGANGGESMNTLTPQTTGDGSCRVNDGTIANGAVKRVYLFSNGNPANGAMNHDLCISSSVSATCTNGTLLGAALGDSSTFKYAKCYDDQASQDKIEYYLTNLYNTILKRQPDASGFSYWISQIRSKAVTFDDIENTFRTSAATDTGTRPTAHMSTTNVVGPTPNLAGSASNVSSLFTLQLIYKSEIPSQRSSYIYKPTVGSGVWAMAVPDSLKAGLYDYSLYDGNVQLELGILSVSTSQTSQQSSQQTSTCGTQTQTLSCPAGQTGSITQTRSSCVANASWTTSSNTCTTINTTSNTGPVPGETLTATQTAVRNLYRAYLYREPDTAGLNYWSTEIDAGRFTLAKLQVQFQVTFLYQDILKRDPDAAGLSYWVTEIMNGKSTVDSLRTHLQWCFAIPFGQPNSCKVSMATNASQLASIVTALESILAQIAAMR